MSDIEPISYPPSTILTQKQVADWLQVSERTVREWQLPRLRCPAVRYSAGVVLAFLEGKVA